MLEHGKLLTKVGEVQLAGVAVLYLRVGLMQVWMEGWM